MIDRLVETGRCCRMETNVNKTGNENLKATIPSTDYDRYQKQLENVKCFRYLGTMIVNDMRCTRELKSRVVIAKTAFNRKKTLFTSKFNLN
jgi:hypothetical protein